MQRCGVCCLQNVFVLLLRRQNYRIAEVQLAPLDQTMMCTYILIINTKTTNINYFTAIYTRRTKRRGSQDAHRVRKFFAMEMCACLI